MRYIILLVLGSACWGQNRGGYFDSADCTSLKGWAVDFAAPKEPQIVDVFVDGTLTTTGWAITERLDVDAAFRVGPNHGFIIPTPTLKPGEHTLSIKFRAGLELNNSPRKLTCSTAPTPTSDPTPPQSGAGLRAGLGIQLGGLSGQPVEISVDGTVVFLRSSRDVPCRVGALYLGPDAVEICLPTPTSQTSGAWRKLVLQ